MHFGSFELDEASGELRRDGVLVRLAPRQFRLLHLLARSAGRVISRDEIQREIWGGDTYVDFQRNLNVCVAQLRAALEDDSDAPRYIETVPRRGYRFVAQIVAPESVASITLPQRRFRARALAAWIVAFACCAGGAYLALRPAPSFAPIRVAVLPFESDGLTSELISALGGGGPRLAVIGRASVMRFANRRTEAARELHADYIVEGVMQHQQGRVRIVASLVRVSDQLQVWTEAFEGDPSDTLGLQEQVAAHVSAGVVHSLFGDEAPPARPNRAAAAMAAVAEHHIGLARSGASPFSAVEFESAKAAAQAALKVDPRNAIAQNALANALFWHDWNWAAAEHEFHAALLGNPSLATAHHDQAFFLVAAGRREDGLNALRRAMALDPLSVRVNMDAGWLLLQAHHFDEAIQQARRALELEPGLKEADACIARAMLYKAQGPAGDADAADPFLHAAFAVLRGRNAEGLDSLERAYSLRSPMMVFLNTEPAFDRLHNDARFRALLTKMQLP